MILPTIIIAAQISAPLPHYSHLKRFPSEAVCQKSLQSLRKTRTYLEECQKAYPEKWQDYQNAINEAFRRWNAWDALMDAHRYMDSGADDVDAKGVVSRYLGILWERIGEDAWMLGEMPFLLEE